MVNYIKKQNISQIIIFVFFSTILLLLLHNSVLAQDNKLTVSPAVSIIGFSSENNVLKESITISNSYENNLQVKIEPVLLKISASGTDVINDQSGILNNVIIDSKFATIAPDNSIEIDFLINNPDQFSKNFHVGIKVSTIDKNDNLHLQQAIIASFILENSQGNVMITSDIKIEHENINESNFIVSGTIYNSGEKIFSPTASIRVLKGEKRIIETEISTQIGKKLLPQQSVKFEKTISIENDDIFDLLGQYTIKIIIKPTPYDQEQINSHNLWIIPTQIIISVILIILGILILIAIIVFKKLSQKNN